MAALSSGRAGRGRPAARRVASSAAVSAASFAPASAGASSVPAPGCVPGSSAVPAAFWGSSWPSAVGSASFVAAFGGVAVVLSLAPPAGVLAPEPPRAGASGAVALWASPRSGAPGFWVRVVPSSLGVCAPAFSVALESLLGVPVFLGAAVAPGSRSRVPASGFFCAAVPAAPKASSPWPVPAGAGPRGVAGANPLAAFRAAFGRPVG